MSVRVKENNSMEEKSDGKRKAAPSIPENYISILQLQERWINDKERMQKEEEEEEERRRRQQWIEEYLKKAEARGQREDLDEGKRLDRSSRKHLGRNSRKKKSRDGGEAKFGGKDEPEVTAARRDEGLPDRKRTLTKRYDYKKKNKNQDVAVEDGVVESAIIVAAIGSDKGEDAAVGLRGFRRKRYDSKKKKKQDVAVMEDTVECGSIAPPGNNTPVKDVVRVFRKNGKERVEYREKAVTDDATAIETSFENLSIKERETKNLKAQTRSSNHNRLNQRHDLPHQRVRMRIETGTMVWVKKGQNERADDDGIASGVKPLKTFAQGSLL